MSEISKRIKMRREELGMTTDELAKRMGYKDRSSITKIEKGKADIPQSKVVAFARALDTTTAYLIGIDEEKESALKNDGELTAKDRRDIARDLEKMMDDLEHSGDLMFDGDPASPEALESIRSALAMGLEYAKKVNKAKYTPKKYRKDEGNDKE